MLVLLGIAFGAQAAEELRGLWVDTFRPGLRNPTEVAQLVSEARGAGLNTLFVEVRKRGDAYYDSRFEPRAADVAPGFDPLGRLLELAHDTSLGPRLEVHAWMVTYNIWNNATTPPPQTNHPYRLHPDWLTRSVSGSTWDGSNYAFDPGHPAVQEHTFNVAMDLVRRYDIDGLHFDYVRYAGPDWGYNEAAVTRYNRRFGRAGRPAASHPDWLQFRRDQVTGLVRKVYLTALAEKPAVRISAATITFAPGITTTAQWPSSSAYSGVLQDWRAWMEEGILDWNIPMAYFRQTEHPEALTAWNVFIKDHQYRRRAAIGLGWYLNGASNALVQTRLARRPTAGGRTASGVVGYSYAAPSLDATRGEFFQALVVPSRFDASPTPVFAEAASVPAAPWKTSADFGHLLGYVRDATTERGIDGAEVSVCGRVNRTLRSDASGFFGTVDLPPGDYAVRMVAPGYEPASADVSIAGARVSELEFPLEGIDPAHPGEVRASAGASAAVISWSTPAPSTGGVWISSSTCSEGRHLPATRRATRQCVLVTGLQPATEHRFRVMVGHPGEPRPGGSEERRFRTGAASGIEGDRPMADRVPAWWVQHFYGATVEDAAGDTDGDGLSLAGEYLAGTDPTSAQSALEVRWEKPMRGRWRVAFHPRVEGRRYQLESTGPGKSEWRPVFDAVPILAGGGDGLFEWDAPTASRPSEWLRVAVGL